MRKNGVRVVEPVIIPARSQNFISGSIIEDELPKNILIKPFNFCSNLMVANSISEVSPFGKVDCLILDLDNYPSEIPADTQIAGFENFDDNNENNNGYSNAIIKIGKHEEFVNVGENLNKFQISDLAKIISNYQDAFSINGSLGLTNLMKHDIELLPEAKPVVERLRRRPKLHKDETSKQIKNMLEQGVIESSESPWASAYVVVKKKTGDYRICIDFRKLNDATKKSSYPLPNIEDCLEPLSGNNLFTQLDLCSGFWQIGLTDRARELTSFRTEEGQFQFLRMPFGLTNAPASFQRLMNILFTNLKGPNVQVFIDDVCLASKTWP